MATLRRFPLIRTALLRKELFIQTCGLLTLGPGNGTRFISLRFSILPKGPNSYYLKSEELKNGLSARRVSLEFKK